MKERFKSKSIPSDSLSQIKRATISQIANNPSLLSHPPLVVTKNGRAICEIVAPGLPWHACETCGIATLNSLKFKDPESKLWKLLVLCDECKEKYLQ